MGQDLSVALRAMEERIVKVKQYVSTLEDENAELRAQLEAMDESLEKHGKGEGSLMAKKNMELSNKIRRFKREREFVSEKIKSILDDISEIRRNIE